MRATRLSPIVVAVVGIVLSLLAVGGITYFMIMPVLAQTTAAQTRLDAAAPDATPGAKAKATKDLNQAKLAVAATQLKWATIQNTLMPPYDVSNRYTAWQQISQELSYRLGPSLQKWIKSTGVVPLSSVAISPPPPSPNAVTAAPLIIPIGGQNGEVSVGGSFKGILKHFQLWNNYPRLVLVDNLALHGNSPFMEGTYSASVIIFPQNDQKVDQPLAAAAVGGATAGGGYPGGGGGGGYPGGGYPGGPPR